jgi:hypothetical protein
MWFGAGRSHLDAAAGETANSYLFALMAHTLKTSPIRG